HDLPSGSDISVFMAPPGGFCATTRDEIDGDGPVPESMMTEPRVAPLLARAGDGVLILGGHGANGVWLTTAEYYDPATATFTPLDVPSVLGANGFAGSQVTTLPGGDVVISGGPQSAITLFLSEQRTFSESVLIEGRAFHTAIPVGDHQLLLAGGCRDSADGACSGLVRNSSQVYDVEALDEEPVDGPVLRGRRIGASIFDIGHQANGERAYVIAGGAPPDGASDPSAADRISPGDLGTVELTGTYAHAAALDGGAVLTVDGTQASIIAPTAAAARSIAPTPGFTPEVRLIGLEDGHVLAVGGTSNGDLGLYDPTTDRWQLAAPSAGSDLVSSLAGASMIRLADGSVLVVGGAEATATAWIYRPPLLGPTSGNVTVLPNSPAQSVLTPADPATVTRGTDWVLAASEGLSRALVGGPRMATGSVTATVRVLEGGVALLAQDQGPGRGLVAELVPGLPARLVRLANNAATTLCTGREVPAVDPAVAVTVRLDVGATMRLSFGASELLACDADGNEAGAWGVGALGPGARVAVGTVTLAR
ncbi:MAG: hypothetical protein SFX73_27820, partial [Kofleriaceae bacterium]|nr:hypothetical protein [Kofleriaceae bacterium]